MQQLADNYWKLLDIQYFTFKWDAREKQQKAKYNHYGMVTWLGYVYRPIKDTDL